MGTLVGCIFHILDVHIINFLKQKRLDPRFFIQEVNEVDIYKFDPFELPGLSEFQSEDQVWYFFSEPDYRNASSKNPHRARATGAGYWKSTGHGSDIKDKNCNVVGSKRTLVFYLRERKYKRGCPSKESKTNWVMHEFYVEDSPRFKKNFVICYIEKQPNKKPSVSTPGDGQLISSLASDSVDHIIEDTFTEVQSEELPGHPLISDTENQMTANTFSEVAPQPVPSQNLISVSRNHVAENNLAMVETEETSGQNLVSDSSYFVAKNNFSMIKSQVLQGQNLDFDPVNHAPENIVPRVEPDQPSRNMVFHSGNHIAESPFLMVEPQVVSPYNLVSQLGNHVVENNFPRVDPQLPWSYGMAFDYRNHVMENTMVAPQLVLPSSHDTNFDSRNHVAENTFCRVMKSMPDGSFQHQPMVDLQLPLSQYLVSGTGNHVVENNFSKVDSSPPAEFGAFDSYNALNHSPFSAPQMPIIPEQGSSSSSYSNSFSKDSTVWSSQFDGEHEDVVTSQRDFQDKNPHEETGQTLLAGIDDETIDMIVNELLY